jgi:hypothetical protein
MVWTASTEGLARDDVGLSHRERPTRRAAFLAPDHPRLVPLALEHVSL